MSQEDAQVYAEGVRRGGTLVSARVPEEDTTLTVINLNDRCLKPSIA
jgi:hypothetical protein